MIGASTGGPAHIRQIVGALRTPLNAAIVIAQHMGKMFIPSFVARVGRYTSVPVKVAQEGLLLEKGVIYICPDLTEMVGKRGEVRFRVSEDAETPYTPHIDALFDSAAALQPRVKVMAILLTGIGEDGVAGCGRIARERGVVIAESEESAVVYGMPARLKETITDVYVKNLQEIIDAVKIFGAA